MEERQFRAAVHTAVDRQEGVPRRFAVQRTYVRQPVRTKLVPIRHLPPIGAATGTILVADHGHDVCTRRQREFGGARRRLDIKATRSRLSGGWPGGARHGEREQ